MSTAVADILNSRAPRRVASGMRRLLWTIAAAVFALLLASLFRAGDWTPLVPSALCAFALFAAWRPHVALLLVAALVPIASWSGRSWGGHIAWPETIVAAYLSGYAARQAAQRAEGRADASLCAIHATIAVVAASLVVDLWVQHHTIGAAALRESLWRLMTVDYFVGTGGFPAVDAAMRMIEGLLLAHAAATLAGRSPRFGAQLAVAVVAGAMAASALNLWRVWLGALRADDPPLAFVRYLAGLRFNTHYADVNAAGSYYVMTVLAALGLARLDGRWLAAAIVIAPALLMSGSRAAFVAGPLALAIVWVAARGPRATLAGSRARVLARVLTPLALLAAFALAFVGAARNVTPVADALQFRREFAMTAVRMLASRPLFGVGIGQYRAASPEFSSARLRAVYPSENAHNNFLQVAAELGIVGIGAFLWVLWAVARRVRGLVAAEVPLAAATGAAAGLLAFVITWLAGHPLLIDEPAMTFWILAGATAGWARSAGAGRRPARQGAAAPWVAAALVVVVAAAIPLRSRRALAATDLEHHGIGVSLWQVSDGIPYRTAGAQSTVFVPADVPAITVRLRSARPGAEFEVRLDLDGRHVNTVNVSPDSWRAVTIPIPSPRARPRFLPLDLKIGGAAPAAGPLLMIGKVEPR